MTLKTSFKLQKICEPYNKIFMRTLLTPKHLFTINFPIKSYGIRVYRVLSAVALSGTRRRKASLFLVFSVTYFVIFLLRAIWGGFAELFIYYRVCRFIYRVRRDFDTKKHRKNTKNLLKNPRKHQKTHKKPPKHSKTPQKP
jgi:D-alanyl-lipoteichoic acid acyltransferase DltB (MBOAT superfamily)